MNSDTLNTATTAVPSVRDQLAAECVRLKKLLAQLPDADEVPSKELQEIRRLVGMLRGGLVMLDAPKSAGRDLRAVAKVLVDPREAIRRIGVWRKLAWTGDTTVAAAVSSMLNHQTSSPGLYPPPAVVRWCLSRVDSAAGHLARMPSQKAAVSAAVLKRLRRHAAKRSLKLAAGGSRFEAARKALGEWTTAAAVAGVEGSWTQGAAKLADLLRDERDLTRFATWLDDHGFTRQLAPDLWRELKETLAKTRKDAAAAANEAFS